MSALTPAEPRRSNAVLIASLCLNLVLAGIIAMALVRFFWFRPLMPPVMPPPQEHVSVRQVLAPRMLMRIAPDKAAQIRDIARAHRDRFEAARDEAADARRKVLEVYGAPSFDKAALEKALAHMQAADNAVEGEVFRLAIDAAAVLTPEDRKRIAEWRGHGGFGWQGHGHGRMGDGPMPDRPMDGAPPPPEGERP